MTTQQGHGIEHKSNHTKNPSLPQFLRDGRDSPVSPIAPAAVQPESDHLHHHHWWMMPSSNVFDQKRRVAVQRAKLEAKLQDACAAIRQHNDLLVAREEGLLNDSSRTNSNHSIDDNFEADNQEPEEVDVHIQMVSPERVIPIHHREEEETTSATHRSTISWSTDSHESGSHTNTNDDEDRDSVHDHVESCRTLHVVRQKFVSSSGGRYVYTGPVKVVPDPSPTKADRKLKLVPNGHGEIWYSCGQYYKGQVVHGLRYGHGENTWATLVHTATNVVRTQTHRGLWKNDRRHGFGTLTCGHRSGHSERHRTIVGTWHEGRLHGRASMTFEDGSHFDGSVVQGKRHGRGTETFGNGKVYSGEYVHGSPDGYGTLREKGGRTYRGHFQAGQRHGFGLQLWPHKTYEGEWRYNVMHGRGKMLWSNRSCYTGQFQGGKRHGIGSYYDAIGNKFVGSWRRGYPHGDGKEYTSYGDMFNGSFRNGRRQGFGRMLYADGSVYSGGWKRGLRWGRGILVQANGTVEHCGHFEKGEPVPTKQLETRDDIDLVTNVAEDEEDTKFAIRDLRTMTELTEDFLLYVDEGSETKTQI